MLGLKLNHVSKRGPWLKVQLAYLIRAFRVELTNRFPAGGACMLMSSMNLTVDDYEWIVCSDIIKLINKFVNLVVLYIGYQSLIDLTQYLCYDAMPCPREYFRNKHYLIVS